MIRSRNWRGEETGIIAAALIKKRKHETLKLELQKYDESVKILTAGQLRNKNKKQKYLRGLFSGGTLCDEAQLIFKETIGFVYSNSPLNKDYQLSDSWKSQKNSVIDLGEDEFTVGRPHPMIDYTLRNKKIVEEAADPEVAVILLDVVLGYGSNMNPPKNLHRSLKKQRKSPLA